MSRFFAVLLAFSLALGLSMPQRVQAASHPFADIGGIPQEPMIDALYQLGVATGIASDQYGPDNQVTRAQMATLIIRAMGRSGQAEQLKDAALDFTDVADTHWARGTIALASRMNIIKGDAGKFSPNDAVNYAQAATMLVRALGYEGSVIGGYPSGYVIKANELGLLKDLKFDLFQPVNRAEAAVFLYNMVFRAPDAQSGLTLSQTYFKQIASLKFDTLPAYSAPGQQLVLNAVARDAMGNQIPDADVTFRVISGSGQVSGETLTLGSGAVTIEAASGTLTDTATITAVSDLEVTPATFQANKDGTVQLTATAMAGGERVAVKPVWRVTSGPATVDESGKVTVTDYGAVTVQATLGEFKAVSSGQAVGKVTIANPPEVLIPGQSVTFTAAAADSTGKPTNVPITWSATNATIDRNSGTLSSARGTRVTVKATAAGITDQITIPVLQSIQIMPAPVSVLTGRRVDFAATGVDAEGKTYPVKASWDRSDANVGVVSAEGAFVGFTSGDMTVMALVGTLQGQVQFRVAGVPAQLSVAAEHNSLPAGTGATTTITAKLLDASGAISPVDDQPITFTLADTGHGSLSRTLVLTHQGEATVTYTDGANAGVASVRVAAPGTALTAQSLTLTTYAQTPAKIEMTSTPNPLIVGGNVATITATLKDSNGYVAVASQPLYVSLAKNGVSGALAGTTILIPAGQSNGTISFISNNHEGTTVITGSSTYPVTPVTLTTTTAGPAEAVRIRPVNGPTPVTGLTSLLVEVDVVDRAGVVLASDSTSQVQLSVTAPGLDGNPLTSTYTETAARGTATFRVPAYTVGTVYLVASLAGSADESDSATTEFVPGITSSLRLSALPEALTADGFSTGQVIAEVVDRDGNVMTSVNTTVTFRKLVDGGATAETSGLSVTTSGGRAVLTFHTSQAAGMDIWFATAPGLDTQNLATVTTTASSGNAYSMRSASATAFAVGTSSTMVIQVVDQQGRVVTTDTGRIITATYSVPGVTVTPSGVTQNGVATFTILGTQSASGVITFTAAGLSSPTLSVPVSFGSSAGEAYSLFASTDSTTAQIGEPITVWVRVMDNMGNILSTDDGRTIRATISGRGTLSSSRETTSGGLASFTVTGTSAGTATLTFTSSGLPQSTTTLTITFTR